SCALAWMLSGKPVAAQMVQIEPGPDVPACRWPRLMFSWRGPAPDFPPTVFVSQDLGEDVPPVVESNDAGEPPFIADTAPPASAHAGHEPSSAGCGCAHCQSGDAPAFP